MLKSTKISLIAKQELPATAKNLIITTPRTSFIYFLPSYIKDSQHALFTMDITSLYTVLPNDEGLQALRHSSDRRTIKEPSSETLLRLAELVLTLNCFSFGVTTNNIILYQLLNKESINLY